MGFILGLIGMWLLCDGWFSLAVYLKRPDQSWFKDHLIRLIRIGLGIALILMGRSLKK